MEKVWEELKKIEAEAEQIRTDAQQKAQNITAFAQQNGEKLIANSQAYAEEEAQKMLKDTIDEANHRRDEALQANKGATDKLKAQAEKHMDSAVHKVVNAVIKGS